MPTRLGGYLLFALCGMLVWACAPASSSSRSGPSTARSTPITLEDVRTANAPNAYELIQTHRPAWLRKRGENSIRNDGDIVVYLNNARMGGPSSLQQIVTTTITSVQFLDPGTATYRFGNGHPYGAIVVSTQNP